MRLTIFGATGRTGRHLVDLALAAGHEVTAVVRDPARLPTRHARLTLVTADPLDPAAIEPALTGRDAALYAIGPRRGDPPGACSATMADVLKAMGSAGVRRLVAISAAPVAERDPGDGPLYRLALRPLVRAAFRRAYTDLAEMERQIAASGLAWTVVRPPRLTDGPGTGRYRTTAGRNAPGQSVARADLADAMLGTLADDALIGTTLGVSR